MKPRPFVLLVEAVAAAFHGDGSRLVRALEGAGPEALTERHRCGAYLADAAVRLGVDEQLPASLRTALRRERIVAYQSADRIGTRIADVVARFAERSIPFALLKGAARIATREPGAVAHPSSDVDVLVPREAIDRAVHALTDAGYGYRCEPDVVRRHRRYHHHDAELVAPDRAFPVELHRSIVVPGEHSLAGDWDALAPHLVTVTTRFGDLAVLDDVASALHLAIHATGNVRLRDIILLAGRLRALDSAGRARLQRWAAAERTDPVRLAATLLFAAELANVDWSADARTARYLQWAVRREDLPPRLRDHAWLAEARRSRPGGLAGALAWTVFGPYRRVEHRFDAVLIPMRGPARIALGTAAEFRAAALRPQKVAGFRFAL